MVEVYTVTLEDGSTEETIITKLGIQKIRYTEFNGKTIILDVWNPLLEGDKET